MPKASKAGIEVSVYLVPPTESPPKYGTRYCRAVSIGLQSLGRGDRTPLAPTSNLTAWVIDDFYANHEFFTPAYLQALRAKSRAVNPRLAFLPLMYFGEMRPQFAEDYRGVIDGVVVAYLQDREEIERTWAILDDYPCRRTANWIICGTSLHGRGIMEWPANPPR